MKTLQDHWREYRDKVYPDGVSGTQNRECHQAFMAGAFIALSQIQIISNCPDTDSAESEASNQIGHLIKESEEWMRLRGYALNAPTN